MPRLDLSGYDELLAAFDKISNVPEDVQMKALTAMEEVAASEIRKTKKGADIKALTTSIGKLSMVSTRIMTETTMQPTDISRMSMKQR